MYKCIVSFTVLPDTCELSREIIHEEMIPLLRQQPGLIEVTVLRSADEPSQFLVISSWETMLHAQNSHRDVFARMIELMRPHLEGQAMVRFYTTDTAVAMSNLAAGGMVA